MKLKLEVENLEHRYLATAGLNPLSSLAPPVASVSSAHIQVQARPNIGISYELAANQSTSPDAHGGVRGNHNETLVRDAATIDSTHGRAVSPCASLAAHGGLHRNHNETLVRDAATIDSTHGPAASPSASLAGHGGLRKNHNETLVRDACKKGRKRRAK